MNVTQLTARCQQRFSDPNAQVYTAANWLDYLNDAYAEVNAASPHWPFLQKTTASAPLTINANVRAISMPANVWRITSCYNLTDTIVMRPVDGENQHLYREQWQESGPPMVYRVENGQLSVYPLPAVNTQLVIEYPNPVVELAISTDVPIFPPQYHRILVEGALYRANLDDGADDQADRHLDAFKSILMQMIGDLLGAMSHERFYSIIDNWWDS